MKACSILLPGSLWHYWCCIIVVLSAPMFIFCCIVDFRGNLHILTRAGKILQVKNITEIKSINYLLITSFVNASFMLCAIMVFHFCINSSLMEDLSRSFSASLSAAAFASCCFNFKTSRSCSSSLSRSSLLFWDSTSNHGHVTWKIWRLLFPCKFPRKLGLL